MDKVSIDSDLRSRVLKRHSDVKLLCEMVGQVQLVQGYMLMIQSNSAAESQEANVDPEVQHMKSFLAVRGVKGQLHSLVVRIDL
jgi:hypothetical protein